LIRYGDSAPPAPREFIAFHSPGARNPTPPMMKALKSVLRCQTLFSGKVETSSSDGDFALESAISLTVNNPFRSSVVYTEKMQHRADLPSIYISTLTLSVCRLLHKAIGAIDGVLSADSSQLIHKIGIRPTSLVSE
jgi:hypothetical protein